MSPILSTDLATAVDAQKDVPLRTLHPVTGKAFFLVSEESYERLRPLFENVPVSLEEQRFQIHEAGRRAGWDDPAMDAYDHYDDHKERANP